MFPRPSQLPNKIEISNKSKENRVFTLTALDSNLAEIALNRIKAELLKRKKAAVIAIADDHGELLALLRMDSAPIQSVTVAMNKAYTAAREGKPSSEIGAKMRDPQKGYSIQYYGDPRYTGFSGGVPVIVDSKTIGAVAVSGLSGVEDMEIAQLGVEAILNATQK